MRISASVDPSSTSSRIDRESRRGFGSRVNVWIEAARPRTLPAGIVPVVVGTAAAQRLIPWRFCAALMVGTSIQVGVNYANDYFDAVKGVDTPSRVGPRRATAAGLVTPGQMKGAMLLAFGVAGLAGMALSLAVQPLLLLVGAACLIAALTYSGGPRPYASMGLGEVFVFIFFGVVATAGSAYVQDERISSVAMAASVPVGLAAVAILMVNNLRDIEADEGSGKITLAVRLGERRAALFYYFALLATSASLGLVSWVDRSAWPLAAALLVLPLALRAGSLVRRRDLATGLGATAQLELVLGAALALALWLS